MKIHRKTGKSWDFGNRWAVMALVLGIPLAGQHSSSIVIDQPLRVVVGRIPDSSWLCWIATLAVAVVAGGGTVAALAI